MDNLAVIRRDFSQNTSCHGIGQLYSSKTKRQRAFWCFLCLGVLAMLVSQVSARILAYMAYKTTTSISEKFNETMEMPAITICNFNNYFGIESQEEMAAINELAKGKSDVPSDAIDYDNITYFNDVYNGSIREFSINKGWQLHDSLIWCYSGENNCSTEDFVYTISDMGKCWTYYPPFPTQKAGSRHGIHMMFDVKQDEYTEQFQHGHWEAGVKVQVHPKYDVPEVDQLGMAVPVGFMGFVVLKLTQEKIMYHPWGQCDPNNEKLEHFDTYSGPNCFRECFRNILEGFLKQKLTPKICGCQPPCKRLRYDSRISYGSLPNSAILESIKSLWGNVSEEYLSNNLAGVNVYYETMSYTLQEEDKTITWSALLSDLGGQLGLWIGISVVTMFEFAQFLLFYCGVAYQRFTGQNPTNDTKEPDLLDSKSGWSPPQRSQSNARTTININIPTFMSNNIYNQREPNSNSRVSPMVEPQKDNLRSSRCEMPEQGHVTTHCVV